MRSCWRLRQIVDVDGQLLAIDAEVIDAASLLAKAKRPLDRQLSMVRAGERFLLQAKSLIRLHPDEVLFFESSVAFASVVPDRLAA